jgi:hypothetical protein
VEMAFKNQVDASDEQKSPGEWPARRKNFITMQAYKLIPTCTVIGNYLHLPPFPTLHIYHKKDNVDQPGDIKTSIQNASTMKSDVDSVLGCSVLK